MHTSPPPGSTSKAANIFRLIHARRRRGHHLPGGALEPVADRWLPVDGRVADPPCTCAGFAATRRWRRRRRRWLCASPSSRAVSRPGTFAAAASASVATGVVVVVARFAPQYVCRPCMSRARSDAVAWRVAYTATTTLVAAAAAAIQ